MNNISPNTAISRKKLQVYPYPHVDTTIIRNHWTITYKKREIQESINSGKRVPITRIRCTFIPLSFVSKY
ncbi:unnamed protein product [Acanthoscelides obtectus]|uniref:Uncharacterized protein n=1 Tax=Acanthoscelides obtectus TaxID=200917 RepID=A0A9P0K3R0_ACAOB|nr:unnamed protein product [Acanthoscelides obtectus]CAK1622730.1 hypothetical protein AOBTE_LOCUS1646 [Acanthoscelides obtectus]